MKIFLVRHGKEDPNYRGGWSQRGLIEEGHNQAYKLTNYIYENKEEFNIKTIISSDLIRTIETTKQIKEKLGLSVKYDKEWRETNNGILAGMLHSEAEEKYPGLYFRSLDMDERYPGGESPRENFNRVKNCFDKLCNDLKNKNIKSNVLVVTHGGVINIIYHIIKGIEWTNKSPFFKSNNTSIHCLECIDNEWKIVLENNIEHLEE